MRPKDSQRYTTPSNTMENNRHTDRRYTPTSRKNGRRCTITY